MPDGLPPKYWDASAGLKSEDLVKDFIGLSTAAEARIAARPEKPELYKAELVPDFKAPEGVNIKFDDKDPIRGPILAEARALAHEIGVDQPTFSKLLTLQAKLEVATRTADQAAADAAHAASVKRLGDKFPERKAAVDSFVNAALSGDEKTKTAKGAALAAMVTDADAFEALEDLIARANATRIPGDKPADPPPGPAAMRAADRWYQPQKAS